MNERIDQIIREEVDRLNLVGKGLDIQKILTSIFPGEMHLRDQGNDGKWRKDSFCGPGTQLSRRLRNYKALVEGKETKPDYITPPNNDLDAACSMHDIAYLKKDKKSRIAADKVLIKAADDVIKDKKSTLIQRNAARLTKFLLKGKVTFGLGSSDGFHYVKIDSDVFEKLAEAME